MCTYHEVAKVVEPKIKSLREAEAELKVRRGCGALGQGGGAGWGGVGWVQARWVRTWWVRAGWVRV